MYLAVITIKNKTIHYLVSEYENVSQHPKIRLFTATINLGKLVNLSKQQP